MWSCCLCTLNNTQKVCAGCYKGWKCANCGGLNCLLQSNTCVQCLQPCYPVMSQDGIERELQRQDIPDSAIIKVLMLGNTGSGKSFLLNCAIGGAVFRHNYQAQSVTAQNEFSLTYIDGKPYVFCNCPGLIEVDEINVERNAQCIENIIRWKPDAAMSVIYVFTHNAGRPVAQDVESYRAINNFAEFGRFSVAVVVNRADLDQLTTTEEYMTWANDLVSLLQEQCDIDRRPVCILPIVDPALHSNYECIQMKTLHATLTGVIRELIPTVPLIGSVVKLRGELDALKSEISLVQGDIAALQQSFNNGMATMTAEHERMLNDDILAHAQRMSVLQMQYNQLLNAPR